ncbi:conserved hypothetical protein [Tenacibaculum sp. 190524A02b]|uniref:Uncharacterized protein n=1 Tax=Tenacibaculum vairaonense TaxID=3137860 RepID=A0ABP1FED9_9FLAO
MRLKNSLFVVAYIISNVMLGQVNNMVKKLVEVELIKPEDENLLKDELSKTEIITKAQYVDVLFQFEFKKQTGFQYSELNTYFDFKSEKLTKAEQKEVNNQLVDYVKKLNKVQIINNKQLKKQIYEIKDSNYAHLFQMLLDIIDQVAFDYWLSNSKINEFRIKLYNNKIITEEENKQLELAINTNTIKSPFQIIKFCKKARFFDLSKYSNNPFVYLKEIHQVTSEILPELSFNKFNYQIEKDSLHATNGYITSYVVVSIASNGEEYRCKSFIDSDSIGGEQGYLGKIDEQEYYQIFNKILRDLSSSYRLHLISSSNSYREWKSNQYFGILALNEDQREMFEVINSHWELSYENYNNELNTKKIRNIIEQFTVLGLLNHLDKEEIGNSMIKIKEKKINSKNDILKTFAKSVMSFDFELGNLDNPYEEMIEEYKIISHNDFNPINIKDNFDIQKDKVVVSFDFKDRHYQKVFRVDGDWVDTAFFEFMNKIVIENNLKGRFYSLDGEGKTIVYLTKDQYNVIKKKKLLEFEVPFVK